MTGNDLRTLMDRLKLDGAGVGRLVGLSRGRISQLLELGDGELPEQTRVKIAKGLIAHNAETASVLLTVSGDAA